MHIYALFCVMGQVSLKCTQFFTEMCIPHKAPLGGRKKGNKLTYDGLILVIKGSIQWTSTEPKAAESLFLLKYKLYIYIFLLILSNMVLVYVAKLAALGSMFAFTCGTRTGNKCLPLPLPGSRRGCKMVH